MDLCASLPPERPRGEGLTLAPGARALVPSGLALEIPEGHEVQVRPRSGLALRHGLTLLNSPGTIDSDYRGEVGVILVNHGQAPVTIAHGMRIAQLVLAPVARVAWDEAEALAASARGDGGFGSTGTGMTLVSLPPRARALRPPHRPPRDRRSRPAAPRAPPASSSSAPAASAARRCSTSPPPGVGTLGIVDDDTVAPLQPAAPGPARHRRDRRAQGRQRRPRARTA